MPPNNYVEGLTKTLAKAFVHLIPGASSAKEIIDFHVEYLTATAFSQNPKAALDVLVADTVKLIRLLSPPADPGRTEAAVFDFIEILEESKITPTLLIDLDLDPQRITARLSDAPTLKKASDERKSVLLKVITHFAQRLIEISPRIPGIEVAYRQAILRRLKQSS
jgi:hypothetical protein